MWESIVGALLGKVAPKVADYYIKKQELKQELKLEEMRGKLAIKKAKRDYIENSENRDHQWELESIRNSGWKDEYVLILLSIPLILVFIPFTQEAVSVGFNELEKTPDWYRFLIGVIFTAIYGIRLWRRKVDTKG